MNERQCDILPIIHYEVSNRVRQVIIYPGEDGYWVAECPSLPGCISQGATKEEAVSNIKEAIGLYIEVLRERGQPVPEDKLEAVLVAV
jgi:predicted RNase H-like HicB family nuclease